MNENCVIDTSALIAFLKAEDGVEQIKDLLLKASLQEIQLNVSVVSLIEVFYIACYEKSADYAREQLNILLELPLTIFELSKESIEVVGLLKSLHKMSFADCCVAGLAKDLNAVLVHKDPEFEQLGDEVKQRKLPYKKNLKKNV